MCTTLWLPATGGTFPRHTQEPGLKPFKLEKGWEYKFFLNAPYVPTVPFSLSPAGTREYSHHIRKGMRVLLSSIFCIDSTFPLLTKVRRVADTVVKG